MKVLVTGCSSGFGELIARTLAADGHHVFATMRGVDSRNAAAAEAMRRWATEHSARLEVLELDVTSDQAVQAAAQQAGEIDVIVNNAGLSSRGPLEAFSIEQMATILDVNVLGPMRVNKAFLPGMRARGSGLIIWVTSTLGRVLIGGGLYPATNWAREGFAEALHHQIQPFGIDLTIVEPGSFPTPIHFKPMHAAEADIVAAYAELGQPNPAGRATERPPDDKPPDPQEVADAIKRIIDMPAGQRPLRCVVGPVYTDGVAEYNQTYERLRAHMEQVLRRPDQATTWTRR